MSRYAWAEKVLQQRRSALVARRRHTMSEGEELVREKLGEADWLDRAAREEATAVTSGLSEQEYRELGEIDAALARLADGIYGQCAGCGGAIGGGRLRAIPEARCCATCAAYQRGERAA